MNKAERIKAIENELAQLRAELEREQQENWRAGYNGEYFYIDAYGDVCRSIEGETYFDSKRHKTGNYFRTEEEAKNSPYYFMLNSEFFYWFPDMPKLKETPKGAEEFKDGKWIKPKDNPINWFNLVRYPKHFKGGAE